jgi:D-alanyl-D-alanine carboxypeptidase
MASLARLGHLLLVIVLAGCGIGQEPNASPSAPSVSGAASQAPGAAGSAGAEIQAILESIEFNGAALVAREEDVMYRGAMGFANTETGELNTPETRFKIASVYKQISAALVLAMARDGLLDLDGSLCQGISDCPASLADVTYHQVLTHSSGIGELTDEETMQIQSNEEALRIIGDTDRLFPPGASQASYPYAPTPFSLLTATPEMITGRSLGDLERELVYDPAGMQHTGYDGIEEPPAGSAVGYTVAGVPSAQGPGNWSTVDDLWAWHRALSAGDPIPPDLVALMETPHVPAEAGISWGYGVQVREERGHREISHRGGTEGFTSYLIRFPDEDVLIALLSNNESTDVDALREQLIDVVFTEP